MNPEAMVLLERVRDLGIFIAADGGDLVLRPKGALPADLRAELLARKPEVLALLRPVPTPPTPPHWLRVALRRWFALTVAEADGQQPDPREVEMVRQQILKLTDETGPAFADVLTLEEARRFRRETGRCAWCGGHGHDREAPDE